RISLSCCLCLMAFVPLVHQSYSSVRIQQCRLPHLPLTLIYILENHHYVQMFVVFRISTKRSPNHKLYLYPGNDPQTMATPHAASLFSIHHSKASRNQSYAHSNRNINPRSSNRIRSQPPSHGC